MDTQRPSRASTFAHPLPFWLSKSLTAHDWECSFTQFSPRSLEAKSQELSALSTLLLTSLSSHHRWDSPPGRWLPALGDKLRGPEHKVPASAEGAGTANMKLTAAVTHLGTGTLPPWKSITSSIIDSPPSLFKSHTLKSWPLHSQIAHQGNKNHFLKTTISRLH